LLLIVLKERDGRIWQEKLDQIAQQGGMSLVITHPDYLDSDERIDIYRRFLARAREMADLWHALPRDVAAWWRLRDESELTRDATGCWQVCGPAAERGRAACIRARSSVDAAAGWLIEDLRSARKDWECPSVVARG
jgi:hypothetical protein